jgi:beta-lactam-binding protein with PASTA domain
VYSTGCLLYELLTGRPPFVGDSPFSVAYQHVREVAQPPRTHNPELPEEIDAITMKALAKKVDDRYQSAAEMRADIQRYLDGQPVDAPTAVVAPVAAAAEPETSLFSPTEDDEYDDEPRKRRWPLVLGVLIVLGLLVGGIALAVALMNSAEEVSVPDVSDQGLGQARQSLEDAGLTLGSVDREASDVRAGLVIDQDPEPDSLVEEESAVDVVLSSGPDTTTVPSLFGETRAAAEAALEERELTGEFREEDSTEPAGTVIRSDPQAGEEIEVGGTVVVVLSLGPVEVPNVVGRPEGRATAILENADFTVEVEEDTETPSEPGQVLAQDPGAGSEVARGSSVTITVSRYEEPEPTPTETPTETPTGIPPRPRPSRRPRHPPTTTRPVPGRRQSRTGARQVEQRLGPRPPHSVARRSGPGRVVGLLGVPHLGDAAVRRSLDRGLGHELPAEPVALHGVEVGLDQGAVPQRTDHLARVPDRRDPVRRGVGHAVEDHGVAHALDAGRGDHALTLQGHRLGSAGPERVDHRLDVLLVHDRAGDVVAGGVTRLLGRVLENHREAGSLDRLHPGRHLQLVDAPLETVQLGAPQADAQLVDVGVELGDIGSQLLDTGALPLREVGQRLGALGSQVRPVGVDGAGDQQQPCPGERRRLGHPPEGVPLPARLRTAGRGPAESSQRLGQSGGDAGTVGHG